MDIDQLYFACLTKGERDILTARTVSNYCVSPFLIYCEKFVPPEKKDPLSEFNQLLMKQGKLQEDQVITEKYPNIEKTKFETPEEGFRLVLDAMKKGTSAILNAPIFYLQQGMMGIADVLEKKVGVHSLFGKYYYVVKEIKLAKNIRKDKFIFQGAFYNHIIGKIQGYTPPLFYLVNRDLEEFEQKYVEDSLLRKISDIRDILNGKSVTPTFGACDETQWKTYTNEQAIKLRDVSLVNGCGASLKETLVENGIETFDQLAKTPKEKLILLKGIRDKTAEKLFRNSNALVLGNHIRIGTFEEFPVKTTEIFLDLEGTGEQVGEEELISMDYLIGVLVRKDRRTYYKPFLAENLDKEGEMFYNFVNWIGKQKDFIIYHWYNYERVHLQRMAKRHNLSQKKLDSIFSNMRDLYKDATLAFVFPTYGNGLKDIAPYIGYKWKHEKVDALESIAIYLQYVEDKKTNKERMQKVIDYNTDDCEATLLIKDWLEKEVKKQVETSI